MTSLMGRLLDALTTNGEITPQDVKDADPYGVSIDEDGQPFLMEAKMSRYAVIDGSNVVMQVIDWDGVTPWTPPPGQTAVLLPDDSLFVEPRGTLNPLTLAFVRAAPPVLDPNVPVVVRQTILAKGQVAFTSNVEFLALPSPGQAQSLAQIQSLTRQMNGLYKIIADKLTDTTGT